MKVISLSGEVVAAEDLGVLDAGISQKWTFEAPDELNNGTYLYRIVSGTEMTSGVLMYLK